MLFLDIHVVPSSSKDVTRATRGHSRNYLRRNGGNCEKSFYVLIFKRRFIADVFCTLNRLFVRPGFRLFCARLAVHYFAVYSVLGSLIMQTLAEMAIKTMAV